MNMALASWVTDLEHRAGVRRRPPAPQSGGSTRWPYLARFYTPVGVTFFGTLLFPMAC